MVFLRILIVRVLNRRFAFVWQFTERFIDLLDTIFHIDRINLIEYICQNVNGLIIVLIPPWLQCIRHPCIINVRQHFILERNHIFMNVRALAH